MLTPEQRIELGRLGRARRPYFLIFNFNLTQAGLVTGPNLVDFTAPANASIYTLPLYAAMSDVVGNSPIFNLLQFFRETGGSRLEQLFLDTFDRIGYFCGDATPGANRALPARWFELPEPILLKKGQRLFERSLQAGFGAGLTATQPGQGGAIGPDTISLAPATVDLSGFRCVFLGERIFRDDSPEGQFTAEELDVITEQVNTRPPRTIIETVDVDLSAAATSVELELPEMEEWAQIIGFSSVTPAGGGANFLQYSEVAVHDAVGGDWTNDNLPIPVNALAALPFDASNKQSRFRGLATPYTIRPGRNRPNFTFTQRSGASSPGNDTTGRLAVLMRTL